MGQHLLADLSGMLKKNPSFIKGDYYNNILENSRTNGALYGLPLSFFLNVMIGDEGAIKQSGVQIDDKNWTWEKYAETLKQLSQKEPFKSGRGGVGNMIFLPPKTKQEPMQARRSEMVQENYPRFVNEDRRTASFESKAFTNMMAQVKRLVDDGLDLSSLSAMFRTDNVNSAEDYLIRIKETGKQARLYAKPRAEGTKAGGYFYPIHIIGINEKSTVKQEAWDFLQFLMTEESQSTDNLAGFPIHKKAYEKQVQQLLTKGTIKAHEEGFLQGEVFPVDPA